MILVPALLFANLFLLNDSDALLGRGLALARDQQYREAREYFVEGLTLAPNDKRFPLELAGLAFRERDFAGAKRYLRAALRIDSGDRYANDFLGTLYFLDGNVEAALKYWNRIDRPALGSVAFRPGSALDPLLRSRLTLFSAGSILRLGSYRTTMTRLETLGSFQRVQLDLTATSAGPYAATVRTLPRRRWYGPAALASIPFQNVSLDLMNIGGKAINWTNFVRWDAQRRRVLTAVEAPLLRSPSWRYRIAADIRREVWNTGEPEDFRVNRAELEATLREIHSAKTQWWSGAALVRRSAPESGTSLEYRSGLTRELVSLPEHRLGLSSTTSFRLGKGPGKERQVYSEIETGVALHWFPAPRGSDYETRVRISGGKMSGDVPFDELFQAGVQRDQGLELRGHGATHNGKQGAAPLGRDYVLLNWETRKEILRHHFVTLYAGPFVDTGKLFEGWRPSDSAKWLVDVGLSAHIRVLGSWEVTLSYGRDLRNGDGVFFAGW